MNTNRYAEEDDPHGAHGYNITPQQIAAELAEAEADEGHPHLLETTQ